jgi:Protein of unknown function (DUF3429)
VIPRTPLLLGWAGIIPFAFLSIAAALDVSLPWIEARSALLGYGACILSFMGGVQWGLAMLTPADQRSWTRYVLLPPNNRTGSRGGLGLDELVR